MKKRLVSLLLAFSMVLTFIPFSAVSAFAAAEPAGTRFTIDNVVYEVIQGAQIAVVGCTKGTKNIRISKAYPTYNNVSYWITKISDGAFKNNTELEKVELTNIPLETEAFEGCTNLKEVNLKGVSVIPDRAFQDCTALEDLSFLKSVSSIGESAFEGCDSLTGVDFIQIGNSQNLTTIGTRAFANCKNLSYAVIACLNAQKMTLGNNIFDGCENLQHVTFAGTEKEQWSNPNAVPEEKMIYLLHTGNIKKITFVNGETQTEQRVYCSDDCYGNVSYVSKPVDPVKKGYTFTGWYTSADIQDGSTKFDFNTKITEKTKDFSLYAGWKKDAELTTDIDQKAFVVGEPMEFTFSTVANGDAGEMVKGTSNFSNTDAIKKLEYYEEKDEQFHELKGDFGTGDGFPMSNATSKFRVTFKKAGTYTFTASMVKASDNSELCRKEVEFTVAPRTQTVNLTGDDVVVTVDGKDVPVENGKASVSVSDLDKGTEVTVTAKNTQYDDSYQWTKDGEVVKNAAGASYTFTVTDKDVDLALKITRHSYAENDFEITIPTGLEEGDGLSHAVTITAKEGRDVGEFTWKYVAGDTVIEAPDAPEKAGSYKVYIVRDSKDIYAGTLVIGAKRYELTVIDGTITLDGKKPEDAVVSGNKMTASIPTGAAVTVTFDDSTLKDSGSVFDQWKITSDGELLIPDTDNITVNPKSNPLTFKMPGDEVTIEAMTRDASIDPAVEEALGISGAAIVGVAGAAVLGFTAYQIGTELYLTYLLPAGAAVPTNRTQLAELVWQDAGKPEPAAPVALDAADDVKALTWAVETGLMDDADKNGEALAADASVSRIDVIKAWKKAQELKNN